MYFIQILGVAFNLVFGVAFITWTHLNICVKQIALGSAKTLKKYILKFY